MLFDKFKAKNKRNNTECTNYYDKEFFNDINLLHSGVTDGHLFEKRVAFILMMRNYINVELTSKSGDYGVDILAEKDGIKYAVQCKFYSAPVGVKAVQEASSGKSFYAAHVAVVATNSTFTANAKVLADKDAVVLWDGEILEQWYKDTYRDYDDPNEIPF